LTLEETFRPVLPDATPLPRAHQGVKSGGSLCRWRHPTRGFSVPREQRACAKKAMGKGRSFRSYPGPSDEKQAAETEARHRTSKATRARRTSGPAGNTQTQKRESSTRRQPAGQKRSELRIYYCEGARNTTCARETRRRCPRSASCSADRPRAPRARLDPGGLAGERAGGGRDAAVTTLADGDDWKAMRTSSEHTLSAPVASHSASRRSAMRSSSEQTLTAGMGGL
jgi:hypothetical protein